MCEFATHNNEFNSFLPADGTLTLTVTARRSDPACMCVRETTASFTDLPVLSTIYGFERRIVRRGQWFRATTTLMARNPVRVEQIFHVSAFTQDEIEFSPCP